MSKLRGQQARYGVPQWSQTHTCPQCSDQVYRVPRRLVDRMISLFTPVQRYRCLSPYCEWEGNLSKTDRTEAPAPVAADPDCAGKTARA